MGVRDSLVAAGGLTLTSPQAREAIYRLTGFEVPVRTFAGWAERGLVVPSFWPRQRGPAHARRYTLRDIKRGMLVARLRFAGFSAQRIKAILNYINVADPRFFDSRSPKRLVVAGGVAVVRAAGAADLEVPSGQRRFEFAATELRLARQAVLDVVREAAAAGR